MMRVPGVDVSWKELREQPLLPGVPDGRGVVRCPVCGSSYYADRGCICESPKARAEADQKPAKRDRTPPLL